LKGYHQKGQLDRVFDLSFTISHEYCSGPMAKHNNLQYYQGDVSFEKEYCLDLLYVQYMYA